MISSLLDINRRLLNPTTLLICFLITFLFSKAEAQNVDTAKGFGLGASAGQSYLSLTSPGEFFLEEATPYINRSPNSIHYQIHGVYNFGLFESIRLDLSSREFSVSTNYSAWPDLTFKNFMLSSTLSTELSIMRYLGIQPYPFNAYAKFGIGINKNSYTATADDGSNIEGSADKSTISSMYTVGGGLRLNLTPKLSLFAQYDINFLNNNIIDSDFINSFIESDFTQTSRQWSSLSAGIRFNFSRSPSNRTPSRPSIDVEPSHLISDTEQLTAIEYVKSKPAEPIPFNLPSDLLQELSKENNRRLLTYSELSTPFESSENFIDIVRARRSYQPSLSTEPSQNFGAYGRWNPSQPSGYTIVIHSLGSEEDATRISGDFRNRGLRSTVLQTSVNGSNYYRVVIGQFQSRDEASRAANQLPAGLIDSFFLSSFSQ